MLNADIIPGLLAISSNKKSLKGFPICEHLQIAQAHESDADDALLKIKFKVSKSLRASNLREGKCFKIIDDNLVAMEVPLGRMGNVTCAVDFSSDCPELKVNPTLFSAGKITIGNVHSVGWLLRDLCNVHLLRNRFALLHGAALRSDSACILLIGLSNTGKTTTITRLVSEIGAKTFGDDLVVTDGKNVIACPYTAVNVAPSALPRFTDRVMQRARRAIPFYEYIGPTSRDYLIGHLGDKAISKPTKIDSILFLRKSSEFSANKLSKNSAKKMLAASNAAEFTYSSNSLFHAYDFLMQSSFISEALEAENDLLDKLCSNAPCYLIDGEIESFVSMARNALVSGEIINGSS